MHIYIHVPFCARRCSYCDFAIAVRRETPDLAFVEAIESEWRQWVAGRLVLPVNEITTVYFGGGTPSRLQPASIARLLAAVSQEHRLAHDVEVTLEANPDDVTAERADAWAAAGVNRVSLGVQSHDAGVLAWMHRTHCSEQVPGAVASLRAAGIHNISMDLIFAVPASLQRDWRDDLTRTLMLGPTHISLYGLTVEPHTPLFHWTERGTAVVSPDERYAEEYLAAHECMTRAGFDHYEVSNAALPGYRSRHNSAYWTGADYVGLGPSAHSLESGTRRWNVREWGEYLRRSLQGECLVAGIEAVDFEARALEHRYLGLRTSTGLPIAALPPGAPEMWQREGWAVVAGDQARLTAEGWLRLDALVGATPHS